MGATRIDRMYHHGNIDIIDANYVSASFSDHHSLVVKVRLPDLFSRLLSPKTKPFFKARPEVVRDPLFKSQLKNSFHEWIGVKDKLGFMIWWEKLVKPGIRKLLIKRSKEINQERRGLLNLLLVRQAYLVRKLHMGCYDKLKEHKIVQNEIQNWYQQENHKIKIQSKMEDIVEDEKVNIYHHELHRKFMKKSSILTLTLRHMRDIVSALAIWRGVPLKFCQALLFWMTVLSRPSSVKLLRYSALMIMHCY